MIQLTPDEYARIVPLIRRSEIRSHLALAHAVVEGNQNGKIFVDSQARPFTALVCPASGFYFVFGNVNLPLFSRFLPELRREHLVPKCALLATSVAWRDALAPLLPATASRMGFTFEPDGAAATGNVEGALLSLYTLEPMTAVLCERWPGGLDPWVIYVYGGPSGFVARSFGFCLLREGHVVSFVAACGIGGGEAEVEVGTVPEYRRRGLATVGCRAFIRETLAKGLRPGWSCASDNPPSAALGRTLGFVEEEKVHLYPLDGDA